MRNVARALCILFVLILSTPLLAQPSEEDAETGRKLAVEAYTLYKDDKYTEALEKFNEAAEMFPSGQVLRLRGYTLIALEKWIEAVKGLKAALATELKPLTPVDAEDTEDKLEDAKKHVVILTVDSGVEGAKVIIDDGDEHDVPHTAMMLPGTMSIIVKAKGHETIQLDKDFEGGFEKKLILDPKPKKKKKKKVKPAPKPEPEPEDEPFDLFGGWFPHQGTIGLAMSGVGVLVGSVALGTGVYGMSLRSAVQENIDAHNANYDANCSQNSDLCRNDIGLINSDGQRADGFQSTALVTGIIAGGLVLVGTTFWLFASDGPLADPKEADGKDTGAIACAPGASTGPMGDSVSLGCYGRF